jgi:DnaJ-class molecular chaperone
MDDFLDSLKKTCFRCNGEGRIQITRMCPKCLGLGSRLERGYDGIHSTSLTCTECGGRREITEEERCPNCGGLGWTY